MVMGGATTASLFSACIISITIGYKDEITIYRIIVDQKIDLTCKIGYFIRVIRIYKLTIQNVDTKSGLAVNLANDEYKCFDHH